MSSVTDRNPVATEGSSATRWGRVLEMSGDDVGVSMGSRSGTGAGNSVQSKFAKLAERAKMGLFDPNLVEGEKFVQGAERALRQSTIFATFPKIEDSMYYYSKAAECFRRSKLWEEAGDCYHRVADNQKNSGNKHAAAMAFVDCALMYERMHEMEAVNYYTSAVSVFAEIGRFTQAAKYQERIAGIFVAHDEELRGITAFQQAADYYIADGEHTLADRCLERVAELSGKHERYDRAAETFEALGMRALQFNLRRFNAKTFFLRAQLCLFAKKDHKQAQRVRRRMKDLDYMFGSMAECMFCEHIGANMRDCKFHEFMDHVYNFNNVCPLTVWELEMLERIKDIIMAKEFQRLAKERAEKEAWIEANKKKKKR